MKLFEKRWCGIPAGAVIAVLLVCLLAGGAFAAYNWFSGTAKVSVGEPFTFGVNYVGWEAPPGADMVAGYYSQSSPFTFSVALMAGESSHGNPNVPEEIRDLMPLLTIGETPALSIPSPYHTFNSMQLANGAGVPMTVSVAVAGETSKVYIVYWGGQTVERLNGWSPAIPANGFIMRGIGVVAQEDAPPGDYTFTIAITRG